MSAVSSADMSVGTERPSSQPPGTWQRMHRSPAKAASWLATASAAWNSGSRADWPIIEAAQLLNGSCTASYRPWQIVQFCASTIGWLRVLGCVPSRNKSSSVVGNGSGSANVRVTKAPAAATPTHHAPAVAIDRMLFITDSLRPWTGAVRTNREYKRTRSTDVRVLYSPR